MLMTRYEKGVALGAIANVMMIHGVDAETATHYVYDIRRKSFMMGNGVDGERAEKLLKVGALKLMSRETAHYPGEARHVREMVEEFNLNQSAAPSSYPKVINGFKTDKLKADLFEKTNSKIVSRLDGYIALMIRDRVAMCFYMDHKGYFEARNEKSVCYGHTYESISEEINEILQNEIDNNLPSTDSEGVFK